MDRYVIREPRLGNPQPNPMIALPSRSTDGNNVTLTENPYYGTYEPVFSNSHRVNNPGTIIQNPGQFQSGIDPKYLESYPGCGDYVAGQQQNQGQHFIQTHNIQDQQYIQGHQNNEGHFQEQQCMHGQQLYGQQYTHGQHMPGKIKNTGQQIILDQQQFHGQQYDQFHQPFYGQQYNQVKHNIQPQNQRFQHDQNLQNIVPETTDAIIHTKYMNKNISGAIKPAKRVNETLLTSKGKSQTHVNHTKQSNFSGNLSLLKEGTGMENVSLQSKEVPIKPIEFTVLDNQVQSQRKMHLEKLQALNKSGPRVFSGPVEKVLKWHKVLKEIGILVLYEIVAKCLSVRQGKSCEKILVIKDENGPAMEVVYYEIDFLLPDLALPCIVRLVGRMLSGSCRLQAFSVRAANADDIGTLPRRTAVAQHHFSKLAKEYTQ